MNRNYGHTVLDILIKNQNLSGALPLYVHFSDNFHVTNLCNLRNVSLIGQLQFSGLGLNMVPRSVKK